MKTPSRRRSRRNSAPLFLDLPLRLLQHVGWWGGTAAWERRSYE
jgi:hypothetical protein